MPRENKENAQSQRVSKAAREREEQSIEEAVRVLEYATQSQMQTWPNIKEVVLEAKEMQRVKWSQQAAGRQYPLQFLCNFANAVLDGETGEITESYIVTIDDKKIDSYYKSDVIHVEPFTLKRTK